LRKEETADSRKAHSHPDWEPEWTRQRFSILLRCSHCKEPVFAVGNIEVIEDHDDEHGWFLTDALSPAFFEPAPPVIPIPPKCPKEVCEEISGASALFWSSPSSAANRVRAAVERMMDNQKVARKGKTKKGKFEDLTLHARIGRFAKKKPDVASTLLAIKWLGNSGSHSSELEAKDMLDAFELLQSALEEVYESKSSRLKKLTSSIIKKKGPV
jgi:hypothetical protein